MKIAILAWGSLVWDRRGLAVIDHFKPIGPRLPIEFSRVSSDGHLTLVIDEAHGCPCDTYAAASALTNLGDAIENLRDREGTNAPNIGFVDLTATLQRHPGIVGVIEGWTKANSYDAAIWTALASNFHKRDKAGEPFSVPAAVRYLDNNPKLAAEQRTAAFAYI